MDAGMQKHRMTRWLRRLFVVLFLMTSWGAQATAMETVDAIYKYTSDGGGGFIYSTGLEAAQAYGIWYNAAISYNMVTDISCSGSDIYGVPICSGHFYGLHSTVPGVYVDFGIIPIMIYARLLCPIPTVNPTVLYQLVDIQNKKCSRPLQDNYYITLSGGTEVKPSTLLSFNAVVKDQNGVAQPGIQVSLTVDVQTLGVQSGAIGVLNGEGGHLHTANRPKGSFACSALYDLGSATPTCTLTTDGNGQAPFIFIPTAVSGTHTITATCNNCTTATAPVNVKVDNLITIPASPLYALSDSNGVIGAIPGKHTDNHYLTATAIGKLNVLARLYKTKINPKAILYLNDASLVWGGLFDVGSTPWVSPHSLHDTGVSLDIRAANSGPNNDGAVLATDFKKFIKQANDKGFKMGLHCKNSSDTNYCLGQPNNRHIHVDF